MSVCYECVRATGPCWKHGASTIGTHYEVGTARPLSPDFIPSGGQMSIEAMREDARRELDAKQRRNLLARMAGNIASGLAAAGNCSLEAIARDSVEQAELILAEIERRHP